MEILPPSDEGGGQRKALVGGREKQHYLHYLRIGRILSFSLPQSASQPAPSSEGAKAINDLIRQPVENGSECFRIDPPSALRRWAGGFQIVISTTFLQEQGTRKNF